MSGPGPGAARQVALDAVLRRLAGEMGALHAQTLEIEAWCLGPAPGPGPPQGRDATAAPSLQTLDRLVQTITDLQGVLDRLAETAPTGVTVDLETALSEVRLGQLARRLSGQPEPEGPEAGRVELF